MTLGRPEDSYVKLPALVHATRLGWRYMSIKHAQSGVDYDADTNIFLGLFADALRELNPNDDIDDDRARFLVAKIKAMLDGDDLGRPFFNALQQGVDGVRLIDFDHLERNDFTVVTELTYAHGDDNFRPDIIFLVNGMPLCFMEVKRRNNREGILAERDRMRVRFSQPFFRRFVNITQIMAFSNNQQYDDEDRQPIQGSFYATSAYGDVWMNHFREDEHDADEVDVADVGSMVTGDRPLAPRSVPTPRDFAEEKRILRDNNLGALFGSPEWEASVTPQTPANSIITSLFSPGRLLFLLRYGICYKEYTDLDGKRVIEKHIMRYPQFFATKAVARTLDEGIKQGVIWHTQGSGKTELAFLLSRFLRDYYAGRNRILYPFFIVDRIDLANQASDEFSARGAQVLRVNSRDGFVKLLRNRGEWVTGKSTDAQSNPVKIAVVNIQKFSDDAQTVEADYGVHDQRLFFIDEAHREYKPGKSFLSALFAADRDAIRIALTGTPLINQKGGANTRQVFGDYIHTYFYDKSIRDGYTLRLLREDIRTEFRVKMQQVLRDLQGQDRQFARNSGRAFEHPNFVRPLTKYIVDDLLRSRIALGEDSVGAMVVARTSAQARAIHKELQQYDPDVSAELVLYDEGSKDEQRTIQRNFKRGAIDILVVYNMLLTGFDAPRLKRMYLCRKLDAHNLLQALTRVNRPYKGLGHGFVVDFADISKEFNKANQDYLRELNEEYGSSTQQYQTLFEDPKRIEADLKQIKDTLFLYSIDNEVAFGKEIDAIEDEKELYGLRKALERYKELRNLATLYGYDGLDERFDIGGFNSLLNEVNRRISRINQRKALEDGDFTVNNLNLLLANVEYSFRKQGEEELTVADRLHQAVRRCGRGFQNNRDPEDPRYVALLEKLRELFRKANMEELGEPVSNEELGGLIDEADQLRKEVDELNQYNDKLANKYDGDDKFMRIHKEMKADDDPLTTSDTDLFRMLDAAKRTVDSLIEANAASLDQEGSFKRQLGQVVVKAAKESGMACSAEQVRLAVGRIYNEYSDERNERKHPAQ